MNSVVTILFALGLSFMATFQNGTTNAFIGPNPYLRNHYYPSSHPGVTPSSTAFSMVPQQHEKPEEETEYLGDPLLGRPYDLSFNKFLTTYKKWNLTGICFIRMNFFIFLN